MKTLREYIDLVSEEESDYCDACDRPTSECVCDDVTEAATPEAIKQIDDLYNDK